MIINFLHELTTKTIILASSSPRRKEIMDKLGINIQIIPSTYEENLNPENFSHPSDFVKETAKGKAKEVAERILSSNQSAHLIIGADTCVTVDGKVFGKPKDKQHAISMLSMLNGRWHEVVTGVYLIWRRGDSSWETTEFHETTMVTFASLSSDLIKAYVDTGEPMGKAGAYAIQSLGGTLIESITGDYFNVMGFPLHRFTTHLLPILEKWKNHDSSGGK